MLSEQTLVLLSPEGNADHPIPSGLDKTQDPAAPVTRTLDCLIKGTTESLQSEGPDQSLHSSCPEAGNFDAEAANFFRAFQSMAYAEAKVSIFEPGLHLAYLVCSHNVKSLVSESWKRSTLRAVAVNFPQNQETMRRSLGDT
jgi:hypothetical protein